MPKVRFGSAAFGIILDTDDIPRAVGVLQGMGFGPKIQQRLSRGLRRGLRPARSRAAVLMRRTGFGAAVTKNSRAARRQIWIIKAEPKGRAIVESGLQAFGPAALIEEGGKTPPHMIFPRKGARGLRALGKRARKAGAGRGGSLISGETIAGRGVKWGRRAVLNIPGIGYRRYVRHPGSRVRKRPFLERAIDREDRHITRAIEQEMLTLIREASGR